MKELKINDQHIKPSNRQKDWNYVPPAEKVDSRNLPPEKKPDGKETDLYKEVHASDGRPKKKKKAGRKPKKD